MKSLNARLFVVDDDTFSETIKTGIASIKVPSLSGQKWLSTISSIMADMLQIEIGDYIFFWKTKTSSNKSTIYGLYRAISKPYYHCSGNADNSPFKIHFEEAYHFKNPVTEYEVLNCPYLKTSPWTIIGKKVAGKPRGTSPLSIEETKTLITLLINRNPDYIYNDFNKNKVIKVTNPLHISYSNTGINNLPSTFLTLNPNNLNYISTNLDVYYEKTLETIFNQEMSQRNQTFYSQLDINVEDVVWYSNYLPYSIDGMEIDYLVIESDDEENISKMKLIEFMKGRIDEDHINRTLVYCRWINEKMALGCNIAEPIIICKTCENIASTSNQYYLDLDLLSNKLENTYRVKKMKVYTYEFVSGTLRFNRKR